MFIKNMNIYFFLLLLLAVSVAGFLLIKPFLGAIFIAALIALIFQKPYNFLLKKIKSKSVASAIMLLIVTITIVIPIIFISGLVAGEISSIVMKSTENDSSTQQSIQKVVNTVINNPVVDMALSHAEEFTSGPQLTDAIKNVANASLGFVKGAYTKVINGVISIFVMFFTLFYFFIDGKRLVKKIMDLSPMRNAHEQELINEFTSMTRATLKGTVVIGTIQGLIGGVAFAIAGVVSPILWTVVMVVLGIIPAVGAALVIFPAAIVMLLLGNVWEGIFLLGTGVFVSTIDNFLRPKLVGKDTQMHSLAVFFATIGGLKLFGLIGFIVGPIIIALMLAMWKIYALEFKTQLQKFNA
jgi:predicted PurR-regulated permease PerM